MFSASAAGRLWRTGWFFALATLCVAVPAHAQAAAEVRLRVTVVDQIGGRIPKAAVTVIGNGDTRRGEETSTPGVFLLNVQSGHYSVTAEAAGFAAASADVDVGAAGTTELTLRLSIALKQSVTVQGLHLNSVNGRILTTEDLQALPQNEAEMRYMLLELAGSRGRPGDVAIYVDGFSDFHRLPPKAAIELVQINAEPYSAEFAEPGTRRVEIITKPGSEGMFGELKFNFNDETLNATDAFAASKPQLQRRSLSGYYAAPIIRDKWGFYAYAGRWEQDENAVIKATVLNLVPEPVPFNATLPAPFRENNLTFNSGYALGSQQRLMAEYSRNTTAANNQGLRAGGFQLPEQAYTLDNSSDIGRLSLLSVWRASIVQELRVRVADEHDLSRAISQDQAVVVLDSFTSGGNQEFRLLDQSMQSLQIDSKITKSFGRHLLNSGVQFARFRRAVTDAADFGGTYTFGADTVDGIGEITPLESYERVVTGLPGAHPTLFSIGRGDPRAALAQWEVAAYAQADWRPKDSLTLSYGFRYENQANIDDRSDFAPRGGLTWSLGKGVIRAGVGLFYTRVPLDLSLEILRRDPSKVQHFVVPLPDFYFIGPPPDLSDAADRSLLAKSAALRATRQVMSNVSYEREIPWSPFKASLFGAVGYTWDQGSRIARLVDTNAPASADAARPDPAAGQMLLYDSIGRSRRDELQLSLRASLNAGSRIFVNYALASTKGDADFRQELPANSYDPAADYGAARADERHRLFVSGNVSLPKSWSIAPALTASSGHPFNILTGLDNNGDSHLTDRPAFASASDTDAIQTKWGLLDPTPEPGDVIIPRNFGRTTPQFNVDLSVMKTISLGKATRILSLSLNAENLFNATNLRDFNGVLVSPVFGQGNTAQPARRVSLGFVFNF
jgi:hypothetical protein